MQKKIVSMAPIYVMGQQVDTFKSVTYVPMTQQETNIRLAGISVAVVAVLFIVQATI